jgi:hypothetical protein
MTLAATCLAVPLLVSAGFLYRTRQGVIPLVVSAALFLLFVPRLLAFTPADGLISDSALSADEINIATLATARILVTFALVFAAALGLLGVVATRAGAPVLPSSAGWRDVVIPRAVLIAAVGCSASVIDGVRLGTTARDFGTHSTVGPLALISIGPVPAALWLADRRRVSVLVLAASMIGPILTGSRQGTVTPLIYFLFAVIADRRRRQLPSMSRRVVAGLVLAAIMIVTISVAVSTARRTPDRSSDQARPSPYHSLVLDQTLLDPLVVAVAREPVPQGMGIYSRVLWIPIPRILWPTKPLSYDVNFRANNFPQYLGAIPITIVGTAYLSFGYAGIVLVGILMATTAWALDRLLWRNDARSVLLGVAGLLFMADVTRVGGVYREVLSATLDVVVIVLITARVSRTAGWTPPEPRALSQVGGDW